MPDLIDEEQLFHQKIKPEEVGKTYEANMPSSQEQEQEESEYEEDELDSYREEVKKEDPMPKKSPIKPRIGRVSPKK